MKKKKMKKITKNNDLQLNIKNQTIWPTVYNQILKASTNPGEVKFWLDSLNFVHLRKQSKTKFQAIFLAPNVFYANLIIEKLTKSFEEEFTKVLAAPCSIRVVNEAECTEKPLSSTAISKSDLPKNKFSSADWKKFESLKTQFLKLQEKMREFEEGM